MAGTGCDEHPDPRVGRDAAPAAPRTEDGEPVPHPGPVSLEVPRGTGVPGPRTPDPGRPTLPAPRRAPAEPSRGLPSPRGPIGGTEPQALIYRPPAVPARPPVELEPGLIGFSRLTRGRHGARAFTLAFVAIYLVIVVQTLSTIF
ncbi:hypothetical protein [Pseudonocardia sp. NPDC049635]|uniref:hypothetical protein n=1 Tax=Pseudonocardia sp. NPDC049635 TaxID=3155506 RepID=UPI0033C536D0